MKIKNYSCIRTLLCFFTISFIAVFHSFAVTPVTDCYATLSAWGADRNLKEFLKTHNCYCPSQNSRPVCTPKGSASAPKSSAYGGFTSTGNWKTDLMLGLFNSLLQGFAKGLQQSMDYQQRKDDVAKTQPSEEQKKKWEEEWRKDIEAHYRETLKSYKEQRQREFERTKNELLGNIRMPSDRSFLKSLLCSRYFSKEAEKAMTSRDPKNMEKASILSKKAELAMSGDLSDCPEEIISVASSQNVNYGTEFKIDFLTLIDHEEKGRINMVMGLDAGIEKLKNDIKKIESDLEALKANQEKEESDLIKEALKNLNEAKESLARAEEEKKMLEDELKAINEVKRQIQNLKEVRL